MKKIVLDTISVRPLFLEVYFGSARLSIATGFVWEADERKYLLTNWHVVSGLHPETGQALSKHGSLPDRIVVSLHSSEQLGRWSAHEMDFFDQQQRPIWLEHPEFGSKVDIAAIPLAHGDHLRSFPINTIDFEDFKIDVAQDVFIIGYPEGITGAGRLPIWKRGSIASEPGIDLDGLPKLLIDSATRSGMSGSPVIVQYIGYYGANPGTLSKGDWIGQGRRFLGIYSGRLPGQSEFEAQLGIVWKTSAVEEVVNNGIRPN